MSALENHKLEYEDMKPGKIKPRKGGKDSKMSKTTIKAEKPANTKSRGEHAKDIIIAMLVTGVLAFIGGVTFANKQSVALQNAVSAAQAAPAPTASK